MRKEKSSLLFAKHETPTFATFIVLFFSKVFSKYIMFLKFYVSVKISRDIIFRPNKRNERKS